MTSGEARIPVTSRMQQSGGILKAKGNKGGSASLAQVLAGLMSFNGQQSRPFGRVLVQLQGKLTDLGQPQSQQPALRGLKAVFGRGAKSPGSNLLAVPVTGKRIGEAAQSLLMPNAQQAQPGKPRQAVSALSPAHKGKPAGNPTGSLQIASILPENGSPEGDLPVTVLTASLESGSQVASQGELAVPVNGAKVPGTVNHLPAGNKSASPSASGPVANPGAARGISTPAAPSALAQNVSPTQPFQPATSASRQFEGPLSTAAGPEVQAPVMPEVLMGRGRVSLQATPRVRVTPEVPANRGRAPVGPAIQAAAVPGRSQAADPEVPTLQPAGANNSQLQDPSARRSARLAPAPELNPVPGSQRVAVTKPAGRPVRPGVSPQQRSIRAGKPVQLPETVVKAPAGAVPAARGADQIAQAVGPVEITVRTAAAGPELAAQIPAAVQPGNNGISKRLNKRSRPAKVQGAAIHAVASPDQGRNRVTEGRVSAIRGKNRTVSQAPSQRQPQTVPTAAGAQHESVNSLTNHDLPRNLAPDGDGTQLQVIKPASVGWQGSSDPVGREAPVSLTQMSSLANNTGSTELPALASLSRMAVVHYNRFVSSSQSQTVFQVDGGALGSVKFTFSDAAAGASLQIVVDSPELQQQLQRALPQLQQEWGQMGMRLGDVNVQVSDSGRDAAFNGEESLPSDPDMQSVEAEQAPAENEVLRARDYGYNTVEFVA